jgi:hypothetical protein
VTRHAKRRKRPRTTQPNVPPRPPRRTFEQRIDERPKAPWHPFPLIELTVLIGIVCIVIGFVERDSGKGRTLIVMGLALGAIGGLDTSLREHFSGYRSHTLTLASFPTVAVAVITAFAGLPPAIILIVAGAVFIATFTFLRRAWQRKRP